MVYVLIAFVFGWMWFIISANFFGRILSSIWLPSIGVGLAVGIAMALASYFEILILMGIILALTVIGILIAVILHYKRS